MRNKIIAAVVCCTVFAVVLIVWWRLAMPRDVANVTAQVQLATSTPDAPTTTKIIVVQSDVAHSGMKLYRNEEFGFEFWYPEGWTITEQRNLNPYIKFEVVAQLGTYVYYHPFFVLISTRQHALDVADAINDHDTSTPITLAGVSGIRHEYEYTEEAHHIDYDFIFSDHAIFIGNENNSHVPEFNQILSTFKFLK
jgi:hypothetical protein